MGTIGKVSIENRILFSNNDIIVVNKTAGEAMEGAKRGVSDLSLLLKEQFGTRKKSRNKEFVPAAVHRLDVPVTGCALFARTAKAAAFLNKSFARTVYQGGRAEKYYWAVVELSKAFQELPDTGELVHWIQTNVKKNKSTAYNKANALRKEAILRYRIKGRGKNYGFLEIDLVTGRHHQIRAQLAALGIHIKGDLKYGAKRSEQDGGIRLHARSLYLPDPSVPGNFIRVSADPPRRDKLWTDFADGAPGIAHKP
ncbi:MAG: RNA pseudouridine synthase [Spirochaetaceae bacterium]|jgi:23S rRNA pseudouridine1911/1915/1917 synthase|nr:RNA pseudouridine synthase [Spirochaetaceae bacterium]